MDYCKSCHHENFKTVWPSGLRRWLKAPFRKGVGSNPTAAMPESRVPCAGKTLETGAWWTCMKRHMVMPARRE